MEMTKAEKSPSTGVIPNRQMKRLDQVRQVIRAKQSSLRSFFSP